MRTVRAADKRPGDIDQVVLVGGSTRIPLVQAKVKELFGREPHKGVNPDEVVAMGAANTTGLEPEPLVVLDAYPLSQPVRERPVVVKAAGFGFTAPQ